MMNKNMSREEKLVYYAKSKRVDTEVISKFEDGDLVKYWVGKLRGEVVSTRMGYKFKTKEEAVTNARVFRSQCIDEAEKMGLLNG